MASNKTIKGITIEIGGNTTKLDKALKSVNATIRTTSAELKDVDRLLKLDPTNTELLRQKQGYLTDAIKATSEKLETEKRALQQMKDANTTGEITEEQKALEREIIDTEQKLKGLEKEMKDFGSVAKQQIQAVADKVGEMGTKVQEVGQKLSSAGQTLTTSVTVPLAAAGTLAAKSFAEVDKTMQLTNKTMGNTAEQAALLNQAMKDAAANSTFGMSDAAEATLNFARAGLSAEEAAAALAPAMNLAAGEGGDLATVSAGLVATINGFGDSFDKTTKYADIFAAACNNSALDVNSLSSAMSIAAPIFKAAGYEIEDASLYMGIMANAGIDANTAATALKTGMARLAKPAKEGATALDRLGISVFKTDGSMKDSVTVQRELNKAFSELSAQEQLAAASAIFGKNQMSNWLALINTAPEEVMALSASINECTGTTEEMADAMMSGFGGSLEKLKSSIDVLSTSFGELIGAALMPVIEKIQSLVDYLNSLDEETKTTVIQVAALAAAVGPLLLIIGKITEAVGTIMQIVPKIISAITGLSPVMMGAIAVIGLMVAAYAGLESAMNKMDAENAKLKDSTRFLTDEQKKLVDGAKAVSDSTAKTAEARKTDRQNMEAQKSVVTSLREELAGYVDENGNVIESNDRVKEIIEELNAIMPGLNLAYDEQAQSINMTTEEINRYTDAMLRQAETTAIQEQLTEIMKEKIELEAEMAKMEDMVAEAEKNAADAANAFHDAEANVRDASELTSYEIQEQYDHLLGLRDAQIEAANACSQATAPYYEMKDRVAQLNEEQSHLTDIIGENAQAMNNGGQAALDAAAAYDDAADTISDSWEDLEKSSAKTIQNQMKLFDEYKAAAEHSKEEILKNMQEQVAGVDEWATNMKELARRGIDEGLLQSLMEMGPEGAGYVKAFVDMTDEELKEASRLFGEATKLSENTIYDIEENYREVGQYAADGLAEGIEDNKARAQDAVKEMSLDTIHSAKKELRIQSPSKEFEEIGEYIPLGMQSGILKNKKTALDAATQTAREIINAVNALIKVETFAEYGKRIGDGLAKGMDESLKKVREAAKRLADEASNATKNSLDINSPSKVFEYYGDMSGAGYAKGLAESMQSLDRLIENYMPTAGTQTVTNVTNTMPINVNVTAAEGQNTIELAQETANLISDEITRVRATWGY